MREADLALLLEAAEASGRLAMGFRRRGPDAWEKPDGQGPVSDADIAVDRMLRSALGSARPDYGWLSEESDDGHERLDAERVFIVDPIDGTRAFLAGEDAFAHSLAVAEHGRIVAAVVHLPALGRTYAAAEGGGARCNDQILSVSAREALEGARVLASATQLAPHLWPGGALPVSRHFRTSLAYRLCLAAEGRYDAMVTLRPTWEWDVAAGGLIAKEAGASVTTRLDASPVYNQAEPLLPGMIVAAPGLHRQIMARL